MEDVLEVYTRAYDTMARSYASAEGLVCITSAVALSTSVG
jgi:hypothetical protein